MDVAIIGCGLSGMVIARELAEKGYNVTIFEKRNHIGGNIYDEVDENGFLIQLYGPHCFFTNEKSVMEYVSKFIDIDDCFVQCKTYINGKYIPMPFNFESIDIIYNTDAAVVLKNKLIKAFGENNIVSVTDLLESDDVDIVNYGRYMYENEYKQYSAKQWGRPIESISPEIFKRVPVYISYKKDYQSSKYQFLPKGGFTEFSKKLLDHTNIQVILNYDPIVNKTLQIETSKAILKYEGKSFMGPIVFTGALDSLFNNMYGKLPYRSLEFIWKTIDAEEYQETEIVAYPQMDKITRITEYKKLPVQKIIGKTKISIEIPFEYNPNAPIGSEPYYPINNDENNALYAKYENKLSSVVNIFKCGRLADYKYYNMDNVILKALNIADSIAKL